MRTMKITEITKTNQPGKQSPTTSSKKLGSRDLGSGQFFGEIRTFFAKA
jgi:hypothetical protein